MKSGSIDAPCNERLPMKLPPLSSGGIIPTYCCSSACAHCLYGSSPRRDKSYMDRETAAHCFDVVRRLGCRVMHVGGGEPFLRPEGLYEIIEAALPAVVTVSSEIGAPRYPSIKGVMTAKRIQPQVWRPHDIGLDSSEVGQKGRKVKLMKLFQPAREGEAEIIKGDTPEEAGENLALRLREAKIL